ncbi:MarR family winged helix-turn-helix transcriptional regulator [Brevibacterium sp. 239c]|uniref:MarR family winged helix-turn-helix transcriptional regulator n=1 Tax=Brevibacterium sp. 239c TaxID=1965356 RepID=UPI0021532755|nr:MarR family transcriptional regulator [Brevibacterium sp. 239c]
MSSVERRIHPDSELQYFSNEPEFFDRSQLTQPEITQCMSVMEALRHWREADRALAEASRRYMRLNESDMRAIRMLMQAQKQGQIITPRDIAHEVGISSASTTKLIDRLVAAGHLTRAPHPKDQRTLCIYVTPQTAQAARETVGRQHARRFAAAANMSSDEREVVIRFLTALTEADEPQGDLAGQ